MLEVSGNVVMKVGKRDDEVNLTVKIIPTKNPLNPVVVEIDLNQDKLFETLAERENIAGAIFKELKETLQKYLKSCALKQREILEEQKVEEGFIAKMRREKNEEKVF